MRGSNYRSHSERSTLYTVFLTIAAGCTALGPPLDPSLPGSPGFRGPDLPESSAPGGVEDELGRGPAVRGVLVPTGLPERSGGDASRTDADPLPLGLALKQPPELNATNGAVAGALLGLYAGLGHRNALRLWAPERADDNSPPFLLLSGALGAASGALVGATGGEPTALLWPLGAAGGLRDPVFRPFFRGAPPRAGSSLEQTVGSRVPFKDDYCRTERTRATGNLRSGDSASSRPTPHLYR